MTTDPRPLTPKQQRFVDEYLIDLNAAKAATKAGYSIRTVDSQSIQLLRNPKVAGAISEKQRRLAIRTEITQDKVLRELARLGFTDMRNYAQWDDTGVILLPSAALNDDQAAAVIEVSEHKTVTVKQSKDGETFTTTNTQIRFKLADKEGALDKIAKHLGMYPKETGDTYVDARSVHVDAVLEVIREARKQLRDGTDERQTP